MKEPILSLGLQAQLISWGFSEVEIVANCADALASIRKHLTSLILIDETVCIDKNLSDIRGITDYLQDGPLILIGSKLLGSDLVHSHLQRNIHYLQLSKPCTETDLRVALEQVLHLVIPTV